MNGARPARLPLGIDTLPPLHVPLRFFVSAALFGFWAGLEWLRHGETAFATRWSPAMLGTVHLLTVGVLANVMVGALFQVIPVLGGTAVPRATVVAAVVHPTLATGAACLALGLHAGDRTLLGVAVAALLVAFGVFGVAALRVVVRNPAPALRPLRLALLAFTLATGLGLVLASAQAWPGLGFAWRTWTDVHAAMGGVGFAFLLVVAVSHQVVPMFHVTPAYAPAAERWVPLSLAAGVVALALPWPLPWLGNLAIACGVLGHTVATWRLLAQRRRRRRDAAVLAWRVGLGAASAAVLVGTGARLFGGDLGQQLLLAAGLGFGYAGLLTIVVGMLPKIVAFLAFLHLQRRCLLVPKAAALLPSMDEFVAPGLAFRLLAAHLAAAVVVVAAPLVPALRPFAGPGLLLDFGLLFVVVAGAALGYARAARRIRAALA